MANAANFEEVRNNFPLAPSNRSFVFPKRPVIFRPHFAWENQIKINKTKSRQGERRSLRGCLGLSLGYGAPCSEQALREQDRHRKRRWLSLIMIADRLTWWLLGFLFTFMTVDTTRDPGATGAYFCIPYHLMPNLEGVLIFSLHLPAA